MVRSRINNNSINLGYKMNKKIISKILGQKGVSIVKKISTEKIVLNQLLKDFAENEKRVKIIGFLQVYNESSKGNLNRILNHLKQICDDIVVYDDGSTDDTLEIVKRVTRNVITGSENDFLSESTHKQRLLELALSLKPDWILWLDADEVIDRFGECGGIKALCHYGDKEGVDGFLLQQFNLWKSYDKHRVDGHWNDWHVRLWKNTGNLKFNEEKGLHLEHYPKGLHKLKKSQIKVIHFGVSSPKKVNEKYELYKKHGQEGWMLEKIRSEDGIKLEKFPKEWFPVWVLQKDRNF